VDAQGGGVLRRNRAVPGSVGALLLEEGIAPEAGLPWIGKIGSFQISSLINFTRIMGLFAVLVASKIGCCFVADASLLSLRLRNSFFAAETFQLGTLFLKRP
jgi:hypothetical protein